MPAPQETELRAYWRQLWTSAEEADSRDIWYAIDEVKFSYLRRFLPPGGRSLEVGCGSARVSRFLAALGFEAVGLDCETAAVQLAGRRFQGSGVKGDLLLGDAFALPFADESFDVVLSTGLLEHFPDPSPIVREMTRVLRRGGVFYSDIVPKKFSLMRPLKRSPLQRKGPWERSFSKEEIRTLLGDVGLSGVNVFAAGIAPPPLPFIQRWQPMARLQNRSASLFYRMARRLDGTKAAEMLGIYYFACAAKPERVSENATLLPETLPAVTPLEAGRTTEEKDGMTVEVGSAAARGYSREYYQARPSRMFWAEVRHLMSLAVVKEGERVLELGCGGGGFLSACAGQRPSLIVGLDLNREAITLARRLAPAADLALADATHLPFGDGAFHAIVAQHLIEHFERPDDALQEWRRILGPGGRVVVATPNVMYLDPGLFDDPTHHHIYAVASLRELVERNGFSVECCYTLMPFLGNRRLTGILGRRFLGLLLALRFLPYFKERGLTLFLQARKTVDSRGESP